VAALAPAHIRGSAFALTATARAVGDVAGIFWTAASPVAALLYYAAWMLLALAGLTLTARPGISAHSGPST